MKRLIKLPFKMVWRMALPIRRPAAMRMGELIRENVVQHPPHVHVSCRVPDATNLVMDHVVRELVRLQVQIDRLQQTIEDMIPSSPSLSVVHSMDSDPVDSSHARSAAG